LLASEFTVHRLFAAPSRAAEAGNVAITGNTCYKHLLTYVRLATRISNDEEKTKCEQRRAAVPHVAIVCIRQSV